MLDPWCKAHELDNLYVVDTRFFVTSAAVNPTLTTVANAMRVGDHLIERLGRALLTAQRSTAGEVDHAEHGGGGGAPRLLASLPAPLAPSVALRAPPPRCAALHGEEQRDRYAAAMTKPVPPRPRKDPKRIEQLGRVRVDDYAWMKDDNWQQVLRDPSR